MDTNAAPLVTVINGLFAAGQARDRFEVVLEAAVHGWMEGHLAAPGHVVSADSSGEEMPVPPFPARESERLKAVIFETMDRFADGEEPAAAMHAAALGWQAGRQEGLDCPGCARAIRAGRGHYDFHLDGPSAAPRRR